MKPFAHPVERAFANLLDEYGIPWEYERRMFVLERDADGTVREAMTPDFYLPDLDLFIETTVMQQRLTGRKRRKVEKLRSLYGVTVEVLYRQDLLELAQRWHWRGLERAVHKQPY
jgi:hypothetical protein